MLLLISYNISLIIKMDKQMSTLQATKLQSYQKWDTMEDMDVIIMDPNGPEFCWYLRIANLP